jgi:hypothetical protein
MLFVFLAPSLLLALEPIQDEKGRNRRMGYCFDAAFDTAGDRLYVVAGDAGMHVFDVAKGKLDYLLTTYDEGYYRNVKISKNRAFVADTKRGLAVFDVSGKAPFPTWRAGTGEGLGLWIEGNLLYLAVGIEGLKIYDISTPDAPRIVGRTLTSGEAWDVWVNDGHAFVADVDEGVSVFDVSNPASAKQTGHVTWDDEEPMAEIIRGEGNRAYVAAGRHGLIILDVSNPRTPKVAGRFPLGREAYAEGLCVEKTLVYISRGNSSDLAGSGLLVVDCGDASVPKRKGACTFSGWVEGVCRAGRTVCVTNTQAGVRTFDIADPENPREVDHFGPQPRRERRRPGRKPLNDPFLKTAIGADEKRIIERFLALRRKIFAGEPFHDLSTPTGAFLSLISAALNGDVKKYREVNPGYWFGSRDQMTPSNLQEEGASYEDVCIHRVEVRDEPPKEGDVHPVYMGLGSEKGMIDIQVFGFLEGGWRKLCNSGNTEYDWRDGAEFSMKHAVKGLRAVAEEKKREEGKKERK